MPQNNLFGYSMCGHHPQPACCGRQEGGQRLPLTEQLSHLLRRPVEVIPEHELNRHIRARVLDESVEL
jgi:hypothetical protein